MSAAASSKGKKNNRASRNLTKLLRHTAVSRGLEMNARGFVAVSDVLRLPEFKGFTFEDIEAIVRDCDKQRTRLERRDDGEWMVAANQGHTISRVDASKMMEELTLDRLDEFPVCVHGTYHRAWPSIRATGLNPMSRQHIHIATGLPADDGVISGMRRSSELLIYINVRDAIAEGIRFYVSKNRVILTPGDATGYLAPRFFTKVVDTRSGDIIYESGESEPISPPDYLLVLDFEATCEKGKDKTPNPQEIIEFPTLLQNARTGQIEAEFHHYVTPDVHPMLSSFCTELTGITQDMVTNKLALDRVLELHREWREDLQIVPWGSEDSRKDPSTKTFLFATCGDWDLKTCLPLQLQHRDRQVPHEFHKWINVKVAFDQMYGIFPRGMPFMLKHLEIDPVGRHHSGIDDCRNIAAITRRMIQDRWVPSMTFNSTPH